MRLNVSAVHMREAAVVFCAIRRVEYDGWYGIC
jgi:hypothetical protein